MHPILAKFQWLGRDVTIGTYGLLFVIALAAGILITVILAPLRNFDRDDVFNSTILIAVGGLLGSLVAGLLIYTEEIFSNGILHASPVIVSWGGFLGGALTLSIISRAWKVNFLDFADTITPGLVTGFGIGRIGCFFAGCCYGVPTSSAWGITFTHSVAPASIMKVPLVPTQLISAGFIITFGFILSIVLKKSRTRGLTFMLSLLVYPVFRFIIEFWRNDPRGFFMGFSDGQLFSMAAFAVGIILMIKKREVIFSQ